MISISSRNLLQQILLHLVFLQGSCFQRNNRQIGTQLLFQAFHCDILSRYILGCSDHGSEAPTANFFRRFSAKILRISEDFFQKFCVKFNVKKRVITTFSTKKHVNATFATKKCVIAALTDSQHR